MYIRKLLVFSEGLKAEMLKRLKAERVKINGFNKII